MTEIKRNIAANVAGSVWANVLNIAAVPIYLSFLGIEAYGLVGFYLALQMMLAYLDFGLGPATVRETARLAADEGSAQRQRDLIRTLEYIYWSLAILFGVLVYVAAPVIADKWIKPERLSTVAVTQAVQWMGIAIAVQFPKAMYGGALMGLQKQVLLNVISGASNTLRVLAAILALWLIGPTVRYFLMAYAVVGLLTTITTAAAVWRVLPGGAPPGAHMDVIRGISSYAIGTTGLALAQMAFLQADKIVLSTVLPLTAFGYYTLAQSVAGVLWSAITPVGVSYFPRISQLTAPEQAAELKALFHRACQTLAVLVFPAALGLAFFSYEVLSVWMQNTNVAARASTVVSIAALGMLFVAVGELPHLLRLAFGWIELSLKTRLVLLVAFVPLLIFCASHWGAVGAAGAWLSVHIAYVIITAIGTYRRLLVGEGLRWLLVDTGLPLLATVAAGTVVRLLLSHDASTITRILVVGAAGLLMLAAAAAASGLRQSIWARTAHLRYRFAQWKD